MKPPKLQVENIDKNETNHTNPSYKPKTNLIKPPKLQEETIDKIETNPTNKPQTSK